MVNGKIAGVETAHADAPPIGDDLNCAPDVAFAYDKRDAVEDGTVGLNLLRQTTKSIPITLKFVPVHPAVDDCNVNPTPAVQNPKFLNDYGLRVGRVVRLEVMFQSGSEVSILHLQDCLS